MSPAELKALQDALIAAGEVLPVVHVTPARG